ncbi:endonuclease/exonuclease/phosphatase family protein [Verrucosispora sp. WMMA2044]|uniref:endonuclease/exonuclease/phosphatase family protein n=1 Tax=unclassified Micromonospora TaxID=2617518 RepID=UPI0022B71D96|nr:MULTISPECIES: endonuclease/exonuclease/phosphatase family protein [unclassified Micromonospora]MCZ7420479.1 endonuclease/exonuclease/phosphatase family protein [Verrucosispora sp. WMMA2121]WBB47203.1 endonuclease/exonuclease/phosphatase family protein [Verrucosispora sp. WMMA2044]
MGAKRMACAAAMAGVLAVGAGITAAPASAGGQRPGNLRVATFNASLNRGVAGGLVADLSGRDDAQAGNVAEVIQRVRPDVLLINEFDYDPAGRALALFQDNYLSVPRNGTRAIRYPYRYAAPSNTGVPSGHDLNNDGTVGGPDDAYGFGLFPGQYGMAVYSAYPIDLARVRTFQTFRWRDMPGALLPDDPATPAPADWYSRQELADVRLSSKSHWDVPIRLPGRTVHLLASHPTPPVFDGPEDRNGRRNHDEIRFWADYISPWRAGYIYDDTGRRGGLRPGAAFVIAGDLNSDPYDGDSLPGAALQLLDHPRVNDRVVPASAGGTAAARRQGGANLGHRSDPRFDTADFADTSPGNLRVDYVLPSRGLPVRATGIFWPVPGDPLFRLVGDYDPALPGGFPTSDHRLVWLDLRR